MKDIEPTVEELERLEAVMHICTLYLTCFGYRRAITEGVPFRGSPSRFARRAVAR